MRRRRRECKELKTFFHSKAEGKNRTERALLVAEYVVHYCIAPGKATDTQLSHPASQYMEEVENRIYPASIKLWRKKKTLKAFYGLCQQP